MFLRRTWQSEASCGLLRASLLVPPICCDENYTYHLHWRKSNCHLLCDQKDRYPNESWTSKDQPFLICCNIGRWIYAARFWRETRTNHDSRTWPMKANIATACGWTIWQISSNLQTSSCSIYCFVGVKFEIMFKSYEHDRGLNHTLWGGRLAASQSLVGSCY